MSSQNVSTTVVYMAYNTSTGAYVTGDVANHTIKLVKDGTEASPTNSPSEVDSTNAPGAYKLTLTAAETQFGTVWCGGKSSTSNVIIVPITTTYEILPTALTSGSNVKSDALAINGVSTSSVTTINANQGTTQPVNFTGTAASALVKTDVTDIATVAVNTGTAQLGVNVVTNGDKTGYSLTTAEETAIADALLNRDMGLGTDSGSSTGHTGRTVRQALRMLRNKWSISGTTQTITKEDDATTSWSQTVTGTSGANPITSTQPS